MPKKNDKRSIAIKTSNQNEEIVGTNWLKVLTFSRFLKRGKIPPRVEKAAGKRQTQEKSGDVTLYLGQLFIL